MSSGVSWSGIAQIESGRRTNVRPGTLSALAKTLGVSIDYLVHGGPASAQMLEHTALLYRSDAELLDAAGAFLAAGVERSEAVLAVTTVANIELLRAHLGPDAGGVDFIESTEWLSTPDTALEGFKGYVSAKLAAGAPWARLVGEPIWAGRSASQLRLWTRFESLLNLAFANWPVSFICLYDERSVSPEIARQARITHTHTIERGGVISSPDYLDPARFVLE